MRPSWRSAAGAVITVGLVGCHAILPLGPAPGDTSPPGDTSGPIDTSFPGDAPGSPDTAPLCTTTNEGQCNPANTGEMCLQGQWQLPACTDTVNGCGEPHGTSPTGYCDPKWSGCVGLEAGADTCDAYCSSINKKCCDGTRSGCTPDQLCVTSRGYYHNPDVSTGVYWGCESWNTLDECDDPSGMGVGQDYCDARNAGPWTNPAVRYRCCCVDL